VSSAPVSADTSIHPRIAAAGRFVLDPSAKTLDQAVCF
jgi:hypothetical protein